VVAISQAIDASQRLQYAKWCDAGGVFHPDKLGLLGVQDGVAFLTHAGQDEHLGRRSAVCGRG
jgi:hypothetical protein